MGYKGRNTEEYAQDSILSPKGRNTEEYAQDSILSSKGSQTRSIFTKKLGHQRFFPKRIEYYIIILEENFSYIRNGVLKPQKNTFAMVLLIIVLNIQP